MADFLTKYPEVVSIIVALAGFLAAGLVASWFTRALNLIERGFRRLSPERADQLASATPHDVIQRIVYFATLVFFLLLSVRFLGISALSEGLDLVLAYIPQLLIGGLIIIVGYLLGIVTHTVVSNLLVPTQSMLLPRVAQIIVVTTAVMTGLGQMSVDISFLTNVITIVMATILGGLSLAFAIGSRQIVANLLSRRDLERYSVGDVIRIDRTEGTIVDFTRTGVVIETEEGTVNIPATRFLESEVTTLRQ